MKTESNISIFNNDNFGELRVIMRDGEPWFVAKEIANLLEMRDAATAVRGLDADERGTHFLSTLGGTQEVTIISESGLYTVLVRSNKEIAKPFRRWVTSEVLPDIRKHGGYLTPAMVEKALINPDTVIRLATDLKNERLLRETAEAEVVMLTPSATKYNTYLDVGRNESIGTFAKTAQDAGIDVGVKEMFEVLRFKRVLCAGKGINKNQPYANYVKAGLMTTKPIPPRKREEWHCTPLVTPKGKDYILPRLPAWIHEYREFLALGENTKGGSTNYAFN